MKCYETRYKYYSDRDGCDNHWVINDTKTETDIAYIIYWDSDPAWTERSRKKAQLIVKALNAYRPG